MKQTQTSPRGAKRRPGAAAKKPPRALKPLQALPAKWLSKLRSSRSRWQPWALSLSVLLGLALAFQWLHQDDVLPIRNLDVTGRFEQLTVADVVAAARPHAQTGFFKVDLAAVQHAVQQLPWAKEAQVQRVWPDGLRIRVVEQEPWAIWRGIDAQPGLVNAAGELFATDEQALRVPMVDSNLPRLSGPPERVDDLAAEFRRLSKKLTAVNEELLALGLSVRGEWTAQLATPASAGGLSSTLELRLGEAPFANRLQRFLRLRADAKAELNQKLHSVAYLDLRYPHGVAVGWQQDQLAANGAGR